jgi:hypothetical protein
LGKLHFFGKRGMQKGLQRKTDELFNAVFEVVGLWPKDSFELTLTLTKRTEKKVFFLWKAFGPINSDITIHLCIWV